MAAGQVIVSDPPQGEILLAFIGRRRVGMSQQQMSDYWLHTQVPLAITLMGSPHSHHGYEQMHVNASFSLC